MFLPHRQHIEGEIVWMMTNDSVCLRKMAGGLMMMMMMMMMIDQLNVDELAGWVCQSHQLHHPFPLEKVTCLKPQDVHGWPRHSGPRHISMDENGQTFGIIAT